MTPADLQGKRGPKPQPKPQCSPCDGTGFRSTGALAGRTCPDCNGTGERQ